MTKIYEKLTADWKAGKLEYGQYWVKNKVWEKPFIDRWLPNCSWKISCKDAIEQILAPVPTYDEYKAMQKELAEHRRYCCCEKNEVMQLKLAEMEELLKECKKYIDFCCVPDGFGKSYIAEELLTRINTALDESEGK